MFGGRLHEIANQFSRALVSHICYRLYTNNALGEKKIICHQLNGFRSVSFPPLAGNNIVTDFHHPIWPSNPMICEPYFRSILLNDEPLPFSQDC
jgi:hypothetical protein